MEEGQDKTRVYVFKHTVKACGAESLVSEDRFPESGASDMEITCQRCRKPYRVKREDALKVMNQEEAREFVEGALRLQGFIDDDRGE